MENEIWWLGRGADAERSVGYSLVQMQEGDLDWESISKEEEGEVRLKTLLEGES